MHINYLALNNFRNYAQAEFSFKPGINLLLGANGQGKTNAVESIMFLATQSSHRTSSQKALIKFGSEAAIIRAKFASGSREALIETQVHAKGANKYFLNKQNVSAREISRVVDAIMFAPEDLNLVRGEPSIRRKFIDEVLLMRYPSAALSIAEYEKVIKHKSTLLKSFRAGKVSESLRETLDLWNQQLIDIGTNIIYYRQQTVRDLTPLLEQSYAAIAGAEHSGAIGIKESYVNEEDVSRETYSIGMDAKYVSRETIREIFTETLSSAAEEELIKAQCLIGPHRDDLEFYLNNLPVKGYASHGETWSYVLALRLAVAKLVATESVNGDPIIILDDVFAELDRNRQKRLTLEINKFDQVIITAAVEDDVPEFENQNIFKISAGEVIV